MAGDTASRQLADSRKLSVLYDMIRTLEEVAEGGDAGDDLLRESAPSKLSAAAAAAVTVLEEEDGCI